MSERKLFGYTETKYNDNTLLFKDYLKLLSEKLHETFYDVLVQYSSDPFHVYVSYRTSPSDKKYKKVRFNGEYIVEQFCNAAKCPARDMGYIKTISEIVSKLF